MTKHNQIDDEPVVAQLIDLPELSNGGKQSGSLVGNNLSVVKGVKVVLSAQLGQAETTIGELMAMKNGAMLSLDRMIDEPIDLILDGHVVARGQLVAVGEHFGVRVTELPTLDA